MVLEDTDYISRCIIYDRFFSHGLHTDDLLWQFGKTQDDGAHHESAVLRRLAIHSEDVHRIGCKIAQKQNARPSTTPGSAKRYYCGFRTAQYKLLPQDSGDYKIVVTHSPEEDEDAHVDVALTVFAVGKSKKAVCRTEAGLALAEQFGPPVPCRCDIDKDDPAHPFSAFGHDCLTRGLRTDWPAQLESIESAPFREGA